MSFSPAAPLPLPLWGPALLAVPLLFAVACKCPPDDNQSMPSDSSQAPAADHGTDARLTDNPFAQASALPFEAPPFDQIRVEHFMPAFQVGMEQHLAEVRAIATQSAPATLDNTIAALEKCGALLTRVSSVFFNLTSAHTNPELQKVQAEVAPLLAAHRDAIWLDSELFARIEQVHGSRDQLSGAEERRIAERYHTTFVRNGAQLDAAAQARLREINKEHSTLTTRFQEWLLADTNASAVMLDDKAQLAGLDAGAISAAADAAEEAGQPGKYRISLQLPSSQGILSSLEDRETRRLVHEAANRRCQRGNEYDTSDLVRRLAALRAERAALLGYANHAEYVLADQMAGSPAAVTGMLDGMTPAIVAKTNAEAAELADHFARTNPDDELAPWDWAFVREQVRQARFDFDETEVRQYFEFDRVLQDGMFFVAEQLYGIEMRERHDLPVYHPDVRVFDVIDDDGETLGLFYADYFARPSKRGGAWMNSFVKQNGLMAQKPVVVNVMNIQKAGDGQPTLLSFDEVTTLFHEFGHAVHGLFSDVQYPLISGTSVPRDYVEFPSQFHEDFAFDEAVLERCARHHATDAPMPDELVEKIRQARTFGQGFASLEYIAAAYLDLAWHTLGEDAEVADTHEFERRALEAAGVAHPLVPPRYRSTYFAHVWSGGYSAGYYAYLWSEALAADAFAGVMEAGGMTRQNGQRFRDAILSRGLTEEPMTMFTEFQGRPLDTEALLIRRGLK